METLELKKTNGQAIVSLNRPKVHNAFNETMMKELDALFTDLAKDDQVRLVVIQGNGKSFCAGGDLNYMKSAREKNRQQNIDESLFMAQMFKRIDELPKPTLGLIHGAVFGGGVGLVSVCDIVLANQSTVFSLSEVKLGLNPSVISPFVIAKIGIGAARRYFVTGERFGPTAAKQIGLINDIYQDHNKEKLVEDLVKQLTSNGPHAMAQAKLLIRQNLKLADEKLTQFTVEQIADLRAHDEAQEGIGAFFEKRKPSYVLD